MEPTLATAIQENLGVPCRSDETIREITRGIRFHFTKFVKPLANGLLEQAQLGLGHSYSRSKVRIISSSFCSPCPSMMTILQNSRMCKYAMTIFTYQPSL
jgi:predicted component of type VI protein secretion system